MRKLASAALLMLAGHVLALHGGTPARADGETPLLTLASNRFGQGFELTTLDIEGRNLRLALPERGDGGDPNWSPDGRQLIFSSGRSGVRQIYRYDFDGGRLVNLTNTNNAEHQPCLSPDGKLVLFASERTGNHEVFVMHADGSNPRNLTNHEAFDSDAAWSPDGRQIVFASNRREGFRLYLMDADGGNVRLLLDRNLGGWVYPSFSPDGKQVLFGARHDDGTWQVYVVNVDGSALEPLTEGAGQNAFPSWSPDGRFVAYLHFDQPINESPGGGRLMIYDLDTLTHRELAPEGMRCSSSHLGWQPAAR